MTSARRLLVGTGVAVALLAGCGVPVDRSPRTIPAGRVPFGLLSPAPTGTPGATVRATQDRLFFVKGGRIVGVARTTASTDPRTLLEVLLEGPTDAEARDGLRSAVSSATTLLGLTRSGSQVTVDLSGALVEVRGQEQLIAIAQLVFTATAAPGVSAVTFELDGQPLQVPRGDGTLTSDPVTRADYAPLLAGL